MKPTNNTPNNTPFNTLKLSDVLIQCGYDVETINQSLIVSKTCETSAFDLKKCNDPEIINAMTMEQTINVNMINATIQQFIDNVLKPTVINAQGMTRNAWTKHPTQKGKKGTLKAYVIRENWNADTYKKIDVDLSIMGTRTKLSSIDHTNNAYNKIESIADRMTFLTQTIGLTHDLAIETLKGQFKRDGNESMLKELNAYVKAK